MIWHAVRMACSSWSRLISLAKGGLPLILGSSPRQGRHLAHLDGVAVEAGQDTVQAGHLVRTHEPTQSPRTFPRKRPGAHLC
jgi:hypothetical protein